MLARNYALNRQLDQATEYYNKIIAKYPNSPAAEEARQRLEGGG